MLKPLPQTHDHARYRWAAAPLFAQPGAARLTPTILPDAPPAQDQPAPLDRRQIRLRRD